MLPSMVALDTMNDVCPADGIDNHAWQATPTIAVGSADETFGRIIARCHWDGACLVWDGARTSAGYGELRLSSTAWGDVTFADGQAAYQMVYVHRAMHEMLCGPIPPGQYVLHACDNPPCCNPAHLSVGTHRENVAQARARGRQRQGERHAGTKFTDAQCAQMRAWYAAGICQADIARTFGASAAHVHQVVHGFRRMQPTPPPPTPLSPRAPGVLRRTRTPRHASHEKNASSSGAL